MAHGHKKTVCIECGIVMGQCRCMSNDKITTYETCDSCKLEIAEGITLIPDTKQQLRESLARESYLKGQIKLLEQRMTELEKRNAK